MAATANTRTAGSYNKVKRDTSRNTRSVPVDKHGGRSSQKTMKQRVVLTRWIILVLLLMISVTFIFLQILSLKAIDKTVCLIDLSTVLFPLKVQRYKKFIYSILFWSK